MMRTSFAKEVLFHMVKTPVPEKYATGMRGFRLEAERGKQIIGDKPDF